MTVLTGYATRYNQIVMHNDLRMMLLPGVFNDSLASGDIIEMRIDHLASLRLCSTSDLLELHSDDFGLAFRTPIPESLLGQHCRDWITSGHSCMSIYFDYDTADKRTIATGDRDIVVIFAAKLHEISFVEHGVCEDAFLCCRDAGNSTLADDCRSGTLLSDGTAVISARKHVVKSTSQ